jgi:archaellum component FlaG (FlaF/FlaG flagellin family)
MNEPQTPPPPPAPPGASAPPAAEKSSPWKWILIGCGAIFLVAILLFATCSVFVAKKAKDFTDEMSDNPAMAAAEMIVRVNPEIELVEKDEEDETLTIRNKETGEVATLNLQDIKEGRFEFESEGKTVTIDGAAAAAGEEGGLITVTDDSGEETVSIGTGSADQVPSWVPRYPGAEEQAPFLMTSGESLNGTLSFETGDSVAEIQDYYIGEFEDLGFTVEKSSFSSGEMETAMLTATGDDNSTVLVSITNENTGVTSVGINFSKE